MDIYKSEQKFLLAFNRAELKMLLRAAASTQSKTYDTPYWCRGEEECWPMNELDFFGGLEKTLDELLRRNE